MTISLWTIGKCKDSYLKDGIELYLSKLKHYVKMDYQEFKVKAISDPQRQQKRDSDLYLGKLQPGDLVILMDEKGKKYNSTAFAKKLDNWQMQSAKRIVFLIGGAFGHDDLLKKKANELLSLSDFTFTHDMSRLILLEQLYRGMTILKNEPYHNE